MPRHPGDRRRTLEFFSIDLVLRRRGITPAAYRLAIDECFHAIDDICAQRELRGIDILYYMRARCRPRDGYDVLGLRQKPGERELRGRAPGVASNAPVLRQ